MNREFEKVYETYGMVSISNTKLKYIQKQKVQVLMCLRSLYFHGNDQSSNFYSCALPNDEDTF